MGAIKTNKESPRGSDQIEKNIIELEEKLRKDTTPLCQHLYSAVNTLSIQKLTWKDPRASQIISDDSKLVEQLPKNLKKAFMATKNDVYNSFEIPSDFFELVNRDIIDGTSLELDTSLWVSFGITTYIGFSK
ncbi:15016_t:CDS:2 [Acaulospora colombiana]|uniref:15016_t:CDS:1 n=1 Tax=Acaulospora colombiana TaxID=27376 RepID=A0ACA9K5T2_9GLOM|nr:15016_t:CDS:2 [Acaulospora colombiana]